MIDENSEVDATRDDSIGASVQRLLQMRRDAVIERLADVAKKRGERRDAVHQLRVSTRRAEATLEFFLPWIANKPVERLRKQLSKLRKATGKVRNGDVLKKLIREAPITRKADLKSRIKKEQKKALRRLERVLGQMRDKDKHARAWKAVIRSIEAAPAESAAVGPRFTCWTQSQLSLWLSAFAAEMPHATQTFEQLHAFRLAGKRLRYALELLAEDAFPPVSETALFFKELQTRLGEVCDQELLRQTIENLAEEAGKKSAEGLFEDQAAATGCEATLLAHLNADWPAWNARLIALNHRWSE